MGTLAIIFGSFFILSFILTILNFVVCAKKIQAMDFDGSRSNFVGHIILGGSTALFFILTVAFTILHFVL